MPEDVQIAAPSTAPVVENIPAPVEVDTDGTEEAVAAKDFQSFKRQATDRALGRKAEVQAPPPPKGQDPAPDKQTEAPAATEKVDTKPPADPVAATKAENQARYKELLAERAQARADAAERAQEAAHLRAKLAEYEGKSKPEPIKESGPVEPVFPKRSDYDTLDAYEEAMVKYSGQLTDFKIAKAREDDKAKREADQRAADNAEVLAGWESRLAETLEASEDPKEFEGAVADAAEVLKDHPGIARFIMKSPYGPQMAAKLGRDPKALRALTRITDGADLADALADLKHEVRGGATPAKAAPVAVLPAPPKPASTPPPTRELSTAASSEANPEESIVASKDFDRYRERRVNELLAQRRR